MLGAPRNRSCLCHVQPYDPCFCSLYRQTWRRRERPFTMDAKTYTSTCWPGSCLGCLFHNTFGLCKLAETNQTSKAGQYRDSIVQPRRQLVQEVLPTLPSGRGSYNLELVHLSVRCIRNSEKLGRILVANYKPRSKPFLGTGNYRSYLCHPKHLALQSAECLRPASMGSHVPSAGFYVRIHGFACDHQPDTSISSDDHDNLLVLVVELGYKNRRPYVHPAEPYPSLTLSSQRWLV